MKAAVGVATLLLLFLSPAWADDGEKLAIASVRLTTEPTQARGCVGIGRVSDDSVKDLRRKILRAGGNTGVLSFPTEDLSQMHAWVYRCPVAGTAPPPPPPPNIPPPPPGAPPPPPPGISR